MTKEYLRSTNGRNEIATVELTEPTSGKVITIIGVMHVGPKPYWTKINNILGRSEARGDAIHYEMVRKNKVQSKGFKGLKEYLFISSARRLSMLGEAAGWLSQRKMIDYKDAWKNHDTDVTTSLGTLSLRQALQSYVVSIVLGKVVVFIFQNAPEMLFASMDQPIDGHESILHGRNKVAVDAALAEASNVSMLWGAAHLDGMVELLEEVGYSQTNVEWVLHSKSEV